MNCRETRMELTAATAGGFLPPDARVHLERCAECRAEGAAVSSFLAQWPRGESPADDLFIQQRARVMERLGPAARPSRLWRWVPVAAALLVLGIWKSQQQRRPAPPSAECVQQLDMLERLDFLEAWDDMESRQHA